MPDREAISFKEIRMLPVFPEAGEFVIGKHFLLQIWDTPYVLYSLDWEFCTGTSETYTCFLFHVYRDLSHELFISIFPITLQGYMGLDAHFYRWGRETERLNNLLTAIQLAGGGGLGGSEVKSQSAFSVSPLTSYFGCDSFFLVQYPTTCITSVKWDSWKISLLLGMSVTEAEGKTFRSKVSKVNHTLLSALEYSVDQFQHLQIHNYSWHHL